MTGLAAATDWTRREAALRAIFDRRTVAVPAFFEGDADRIAELCHRLAERFARGGRLLAIGQSPAAGSDVRHVTVEFVHPVIVGKRALPAMGLVGDAGRLARGLDVLVEPRDIVIAFGSDEGSGGAWDALGAARRRGCLTVGFGVGDADWTFAPGHPDPFVRQEIVETLYHILWELVHVFFEHRGLLEGRAERPRHDSGSARFLYPFLGQDERRLDDVMADCSRSVRAKAADITALRLATLEAGGSALLAAAGALRRALWNGGRILALGNGGSATDAMDLVADCFDAPQGWPARPALDLTEDSAILTAMANDVGPDAIFARQIIAFAREADVVVAFSTSGSSANVVAALREARERGLAAVAFVGDDGGRIMAEQLADHVVVSPSPYIPRIQEAHATAYHALRELVELPDFG